MVSFCSWIYIKLFFGQFLDICNSAGSLFGEAISLFQTFQRLTSVRQFSVRLSNDCTKMFDWASNLIQIISEAVFNFNPLTDFEIFTIYVFIIPLPILVFINAYSIGITSIFHLIYEVSLALLIGGIKLVFLDRNIIGSYLVAPSIAMIFVVSLYLLICCICSRCKGEKFSCCKSNTENKIDTFGNFRYTLSIMLASIVFVILIYPIASVRYQLSIFVIGFTSALIIMFFIIDICLLIISKYRNKTHAKINTFLINIFTLLFIPGTDSLTKIISGGYRKRWECYAAYGIILFIIPIIITLLTIINHNPDLNDKYKRAGSSLCNPYHYIEFVDIIKQAAFSLTSAFDFTYISLCIEIFWFLLILAILPFRRKSDHCLVLGSSFVVITGTSAALYSEKHGTKIFSFGLTLFFVIFSCIPAIISFYFFFFLDFEVKHVNDSSDVDLSDDSSKGKSPISKAFYSVRIVTPFAFILYGINANIIFNKRYMI